MVPRKYLLSLILAIFVQAAPVRSQPPCTPSFEDSAGLQLVLLDPIKYPFATCNDGTMAFFYMHRASASPHLVIYLEGGEMCANVEACEQRSKAARWQTSANSTKYCTPITGRTILDSDKRQNPIFHSWNHVYIPYCTSDLHLGRTLVPPFSGAKAASGSFVFRGAFVVESVIRELQGRFGLGNESDAAVLFAGEVVVLSVWPNLRCSCTCV